MCLIKLSSGGQSKVRSTGFREDSENDSLKTTINPRGKKSELVEGKENGGMQNRMTNM